MGSRAAARGEGGVTPCRSCAHSCCLLHRHASACCVRCCSSSIMFTWQGWAFKLLHVYCTACHAGGASIMAVIIVRVQSTPSHNALTMLHQSCCSWLRSSAVMLPDVMWYSACEQITCSPLPAPRHASSRPQPLTVHPCSRARRQGTAHRGRKPACWLHAMLT
jgi:hypothetical protein